MAGCIGGEGEVFHHFLIPLEKLDSKPALVGRRDHVPDQVGNGGEGVLYRLVKSVLWRESLPGGRQSGGLFSSSHAALALYSRGLHYRTAQSFGQLGGVDLVAVLLGDVNHV